MEGGHVFRHTGAVLISESHYFPKYRDSIHEVLVLQQYADLLTEFMGLVLFITFVVEAHVHEASNVCRRLQVHHLPSRCIYLVWSSISELHRQPKIFDHEHVPHLRLLYWVVGAGELEHAAELVFHLLSCLKSSTSLWYQSKRNGRRPQPSFNPLRMLKDVDVSLGSKFCLFQNFNDSLHYHVCVYKFINGYIFLNIEWIWLCVTCVCVLKLKCRCENVCSLWCM